MTRWCDAPAYLDDLGEGECLVDADVKLAGLNPVEDVRCAPDDDDDGEAMMTR